MRISYVLRLFAEKLEHLWRYGLYRKLKPNSRKNGRVRKRRKAIAGHNETLFFQIKQKNVLPVTSASVPSSRSKSRQLSISCHHIETSQLFWTGFYMMATWKPQSSHQTSYIQLAADVRSKTRMIVRLSYWHFFGLFILWLAGEELWNFGLPQK